jgi:hypothetical protein
MRQVASSDDEEMTLNRRHRPINEPGEIGRTNPNKHTKSGFRWTC